MLGEWFTIGFTPHDPTWAASKTLLIPLRQQRHPRFHGSPAGVKVLMSASQRPPTPPMTNGTVIPPIHGESLGVDGIVLHLQQNVNRWFLEMFPKFPVERSYCRESKPCPTACLPGRHHPLQPPAGLHVIGSYT